MTLHAMICPSHFEHLGTDCRWDGETLIKANGFLYQIESSSFWSVLGFYLKSCHIFEVLSYLRGLTFKLQMQSVDVMHTYEEVDSVVSTLKNMKGRSVQEFNKIYTEANKLGKELHGKDFELCQP